MKRKIMTMVLSLAMLAGVAQELATIASYNVRVFNANDEAQGNVWSRRCKAICDQMNFVSPVAFGTQEVTYKQLVDVTTASWLVNSWQFSITKSSWNCLSTTRSG